MTTTIERIRRDATKTMLAQVDAFIANCQNLDFAQLREGQEIRETLGELVRARREFDAKLFFIVIFGPVKAGKSTLVNCLAREYVSPTEYGKECTRRPSIIIQDEQTGIDEYFLVDTSLGRERAFDRVIDCLRGMIAEDELRNLVRKETSPLSKANIEKKLSLHMEMDPLITVIRVPGGDLVRKGIALVDTPGFDGMESNSRESPVYTWVLERSDFIIFIQSSIAALNMDARDFLESLVKRSKNPPFWLVQNFIDARHWRERNERLAEAVGQKEEAKKVIARNLGVPEDELPSLAINLGMASDGIFQGAAELLAESAFESFEHNLRETLNTQRVIFQEHNSVRGMPKALEDVRLNLDRCARRLGETRTAYESVQARLDECIKRLNMVIYDESTLLRRLEEEIQVFADDAYHKWHDSLQEKKRVFEIDNNRRLTGKELQAKLEAMAAALAQEGAERHFSPAGPLGTKLRERAGEASRGAEQAAVGEVDAALAGLGLGPVPRHEVWTEERLPQFERSPLEFEAVEKRGGPLGLLIRHYDGGEIKIRLDRIAAGFQQRMEERKRDWLRSFRTRFLNDYCEERRRLMTDHLREEKKRHDAVKQPELERIERSLKLIEELNLSLSALSAAAGEAAAAVERGVPG